MLSAERLTVKASQAIQAAAAGARQRESAEILGLHLLQALLEQEEGIVTPVLRKLGVQVPLLRERLAEALNQLPKVSGGAEPGLSRDLNRALDKAESATRDLEDEYVSTEHLLLALTEEEGDAGKLLQDGGATREAVLPGRLELRS